MRARFRSWWQKLKQHWVAFGVGAIVCVVVIVITIIGKTPRRMMLERGAHSNWAKKLVSSPRLIEGLSPFLGMGADCR